MSYLLDTNVVVAVLRGRPPSVRSRLREVRDRRESLALSSVALYELWYGVARAVPGRHDEPALKAFLAGDIELLAFDEQDAAMAGRLRADLEAVGRPIGPYDLQIAAQALRRNLILVTSNVGEFSRVEGLRYENWGS